MALRTGKGSESGGGGGGGGGGGISPGSAQPDHGLEAAGKCL